VDERFIEKCVDEEISIGDYVLTGGELPALVVADVLTRLIPGVVGNGRSLTEDSLEGDLLKYPQYTRPKIFEGLGVPDVLLSGNHAKIAEWRQSERVRRTREKRPDLLKK
jgi:tRNA (guanine37-N1)-methyltransferase